MQELQPKGPQVYIPGQSFTPEEIQAKQMERQERSHRVALAGQPSVKIDNPIQTNPIKSQTENYNSKIHFSTDNKKESDIQLSTPIVRENPLKAFWRKIKG